MEILAHPFFATDDNAAWVQDESVDRCSRCQDSFGMFNRKHHCRNCGKIFCHGCSSQRTQLPGSGHTEPVRVCHACYADASDQAPAPAPVPAPAPEWGYVAEPPRHSGTALAASVVSAAPAEWGY